MLNSAHLRLFFIIFSGGIISSCTSPTAEQIVLDSLEFHGGLETWQQLERMTYTKKTTLYNSDGSIEIDAIATYEHQIVPTFKSSKTWIEADSTLSYSLTNDANIDLANFKDEASYNKAKSDLDGAYFVIQQPYKLLENKEDLEYIGQDLLGDGTTIDIVKLQYYNQDGSKDNTWWFYFNENSHRMEGYMVKHDSTFAFIRNETYETVTGLSLCQTRTSYRVDSLRNVQYIRGKYRYDFAK